MLRDQIKVASISMTSTEDKPKNVQMALDKVRQAAAEGADWIVLPEVFAYHGGYEQIYQNGESEDGPLLTQLRQLAKELAVILFAGSLGERPLAGEISEADLLGRTGCKRVFNTCFVFGRQGELLCKYRKVHLFNLLGPNGEPLYCESDGFLAGDQLVSLDIDGWRVGLAICYDLRFPSFFESLARQHALDCIVIPSAFTLQTGMDHWELLLRARAVEQQCYVLASNQVGEHGRGRSSYGHSMIIDPWGYVIANTGGLDGSALSVITQARIKTVRARLPALKNRRNELYV